MEHLSGTADSLDRPVHGLRNSLLSTILQVARQQVLLTIHYFGQPHLQLIRQY